MDSWWGLSAAPWGAGTLNPWQALSLAMAAPAQMSPFSGLTVSTALGTVPVAGAIFSAAELGSPTAAPAAAGAGQAGPRGERDCDDASRLLACFDCGLFLSTTVFSAKQLRRGLERRCETCVTAALSAKLPCARCQTPKSLSHFDKDQRGRGAEATCKVCAAPPRPAEPAPKPSAGAGATTASSSPIDSRPDRVCPECRQSRPGAEFSRHQWEKKPSGAPVCRTCVTRCLERPWRCSLCHVLKNKTHFQPRSRHNGWRAECTACCNAGPAVVRQRAARRAEETARRRETRDRHETEMAAAQRRRRGAQEEHRREQERRREQAFRRDELLRAARVAMRAPLNPRAPPFVPQPAAPAPAPAQAASYTVPPPLHVLKEKLYDDCSLCLVPLSFAHLSSTQLEGIDSDDRDELSAIAFSIKLAREAALGPLPAGSATSSGGATNTSSAEAIMEGDDEEQADLKGKGLEMTKCQHLFHSACLRRLEAANTDRYYHLRCPNCRTTLRKGTGYYSEDDGWDDDEDEDDW